MKILYYILLIYVIHGL